MRASVTVRYFHHSAWRRSLVAFFDERAGGVAGPPTIEELCFIAGREPRLWSDPDLRADLAASIVAECRASSSSSMLEVGCAAGFLAHLVAPLVGRYEGVDLAAEPLRVARRLGLQNAEFRRAEGERLPYADNSFDAAFCYDVYTNFPTFEDGVRLVEEMIRVVRRGGRALVGSIPDAATQSDYPARVAEVMDELEQRHGPVPSPPPVERLETPWARLRRRVGAPLPRPEVVCYYFRKESFRALAARLDVPIEIRDIHSLNPYRGYRFNAILQKGRA